MKRLIGFGLLPSPNKERVRGTIAEETARRRKEGIHEPVLGKTGKPILTSVWAPSQEQLKEIRTNRFHRTITFTGRTFPFVVRNLIKLYSEIGDFVYDPMIGSGTTLYEGTLLDRKVKGSDLNPDTVKRFTARWKSVCRDLPIPEVRVSNAENLPHVPSNSVQLVVMSFPWFTSWKFSKDPKSASMENSRTQRAFFLQSCRIYREIARVLRPGGFVANILGNTFIRGRYYSITSLMPEVIRESGLEYHYQFWSLRVEANFISFPWNRSGLDTKINKSGRGVGWDVHEDIIIARKPEVRKGR